jgi:outer membrane protein assembly factor BamB
MELNDMIFTGFNRRVAALDRRTGMIIWQWQAKAGRTYVTLLLEGDMLIVSVDGHMYGLNAMTGVELWYNEMSGFGTGVASLASVNGSAANVHVSAAKARSLEST